MTMKYKIIMGSQVIKDTTNNSRGQNGVSGCENMVHRGAGPLAY